MVTRRFLVAAMLGLTAALRAEEATPRVIERKAGDLLVAVRAGFGEACSEGSYDLRVYQGSKDGFIAGVVRPRDGEIEECWFRDLNGDGKPEVVVALRCVGSGSYGRLEIFTFAGNKLSEVNVAEPPKRPGASYMGHDRYELREGRIVRAYPLYKDADPNSAPTGGEAKFTLDLDKKQWCRAD